MPADDATRLFIYGQNDTASATANDGNRERLIGTWRLVGVQTEDLATGAKSEGWGLDPQGFINCAPVSRMVVMNLRSGHTKPTRTARAAR